MPFYYFYPEIEIPQKDKNERPHPWERCIKDTYTGKFKYCHNSMKNPIYPPPKKGKVPNSDRVKFTVVGTSITKEFIYCAKIVKGLHKYRWKHFDAPVIKGVTSVEWPSIWHDLKIQYGGEAYCLESQVAVIANDQFVGGEKELKKLIETKYVYYITPDYYVEAIKQFSNFLASSGRPCASLEMMIDHKEIGPMIFMLYSDIVPHTCENFLRLCKETKGGYAGTPVHRIVKDSWIQCGGYGLKKSDLDCENFIVPHDRRGVIAMCNAGRHVDCSTQFFILLQPQDWMAHKYVAFGQLISGNHVLREIEQVKEWYGSPEKDIVIAKASILNLECHDIRINKGTNKYLEAHHENLLEIGQLFYEELLEKVWLEAEFRELQRIQAEMIELAPEQTEFTPEEAASNLRTTQRFMRKKEEIDRQILERSLAGTGKTTPANTVADKLENNDFDVEEYEYMPEEYSYKQVTPALSGNSSEIVKTEKPYLIPFTDVPYPGEVTSEYDLKRKLQGHYCLESDIEMETDKTKKKLDVDKLQNHPEKLEELFKTVSSENISENSLNSDEQKEITTYLKDNADGVSFAGDVIKNLARSGKLINVFDRLNVSELITDEALRKFRVAQDEFRRENEKVKIVESKSIEMRKEKIRRKQTGFVRPEDLARMRQHSDLQGYEDDFDDDDEEDNYLPYTRQVSVQHPRSITRLKKESVEVTVKSSDDLLDDMEEEIEEGQKQEQSKFESLRRAHFVRKDVMITVDEDDGDDKGRDSDEDSVVSLGGVRPGVSSEKRTSGLTRLFDDVAAYDQGPGPTLKNYVPFSERQHKASLCLITFSADKRAMLGGPSQISREMYLKRRFSVDRTDFQPIDEVLLLQHGQKVYRKMSTDYVRTIDHIEQKEEASLRSLEYAKYRPGISVSDYHKRNKEYREKLETEKLNKPIKTSKLRLGKFLILHCLILFFVERRENVDQGRCEATEKHESLHHHLSITSIQIIFVLPKLILYLYDVATRNRRMQ